MKMNERELEMGLSGTKNSWHMEYKDSAWIFIGGMPYELSEGDMICMFSQYGEVVHVNLVRDHNTGKSRGFGFLCYEDQRSTNLAVDNLNAFKILNRLIRVDHVHKYKLPKDLEKLDDDKKRLFLEGCAPKEIEIEREKSSSEDLLPMAEEEKKKKKKRKKTKKKKKKRDSSEDSDSSSSDSEAERKKKKKRRKRKERSDSSSAESEEESRKKRKKKKSNGYESSSSDSDDESVKRKEEVSRGNYERSSATSQQLGNGRKEIKREKDPDRRKHDRDNRENYLEKGSRNYYDRNGRDSNKDDRHERNRERSRDRKQEDRRKNRSERSRSRERQDFRSRK